MEDGYKKYTLVLENLRYNTSYTEGYTSEIFESKIKLTLQGLTVVLYEKTYRQALKLGKEYFEEVLKVHLQRVGNIEPVLEKHSVTLKAVRIEEFQPPSPY